MRSIEELISVKFLAFSVGLSRNEFSHEFEELQESPSTASS